MVHQDHETRIGAHRIFSVVLVPSSVAPCKNSTQPTSGKAAHISRSLSRTVSAFSSSAALFEKLRKERSGSKENVLLSEENSNNGVLNRLKSSFGRADSMKNLVPEAAEEGPLSSLTKQVVSFSLVFLFKPLIQLCCCQFFFLCFPPELKKKFCKFGFVGHEP